MSKSLVIIDYHLGNLFSVNQACLSIGLNPIVSHNITDIENADGLILPGVGAFQEAMTNLNNSGITNAIKKAISLNKPLFGICLGLQILLSESEEFGKSEGLDLIKGKALKFPSTVNESRIKVPQIGWNSIYPKSREWKNTPLENISPNDYMYFVHSFYASITDPIASLCYTNYEGIEFVSGIQKNSIFATQFHPEKSGKIGLEIYKSWAQQNQFLS